MEKHLNYFFIDIMSSFANRGTVIGDGGHVTYLDFISHMIRYVVAVSV